MLERNCSVARTMNILCDAWAFLIMREAFFGIRNFEGFRRALGVPRATLTSRLADLTAQGIFKRVHPSSDARRQEYRLTRKGYDLYPSCMALKQFGDDWLAKSGKLPLVLVHEDCGCTCKPIVACSECLTEVKARDVTYYDGPGAGQERSKPGRNARRSSENPRFILGRPSSVSRALQIIGDKWSFMVMREAFFGARRYEQMQSRLNIAPNILTNRLAHFVKKGVFFRRPYNSTPPRYEYILTKMGLDLYGPCIAMLAWGDRWLSGGKPPLILRHMVCGKEFRPVVICNRCRKEIHAGAMRYRLNYNPRKYQASTNERLVS